MSKNQWFTIYWLDGSKSFVYGESIDKAFTAAGYGGGAVNAIDWYDEGVSNTHQRDHQKKKWVPFKEHKLSYSEFIVLDIGNILDLMKNGNSIQVEFENKDFVSLSQKWGQFYLDKETVWVEYLELTYGEYFKGTYGGDSDDEENSHHFMMSQGQYFNPADIAFAVEAFMQRVRHEPFMAVKHDHCKQLEEIHQSQKVKYVC